MVSHLGRGVTLRHLLQLMGNVPKIEAPKRCQCTKHGRDPIVSRPYRVSCISCIFALLPPFFGNSWSRCTLRAPRFPINPPGRLYLRRLASYHTNICNELIVRSTLSMQQSVYIILYIMPLIDAINNHTFGN